MALKIRRGSDQARLQPGITPSEGELIYTTDTKQVFVGDGSTLGGIRVTSGVATGTQFALAGYATAGDVVSPTTNLIWSDTTNTLKIDAGVITANTQNIGRSVVNINGHFNSAAGQSLTFNRSRGYELVPQSVASGDVLGGINFNAYITNAYFTGSSISTNVATAPGAVGPNIVINFTSKSGTGPYSVTFSIPSQTAPTIAKSYTISGNSNDLYNGSFVVTASTTTSVTFFYLTDPGAFGTGATVMNLDPALSTDLNIFTSTSNGNRFKTLRVFNNGQIYVGPIASDFSSNAYDPSWNGQLNITSTQTTAGQTTAGAQLAMRTYANTTYAQNTNIVRYRGTVVTPTTILEGDQVHIVKYLGYDGTTTRSVASMIVYVDDPLSPGLGSAPGAIVFNVGTTGVAGALSPALRITSDLQTTFYGPTKYVGVKVSIPFYINVATTGTYSLSTTKEISMLLITNTGLTASIVMPPAPVDGQHVKFAVSGNSVTLTVSGTPTVLPTFAGVATDGTTFQYVYRASNTTWYKIG